MMMIIHVSRDTHLMLTLVTTEPPLRPEHLGVIKLGGGYRGDKGGILDIDT